MAFASFLEQALVQNVSIKNEFVWHENESWKWKVKGEICKNVIECFRKKEDSFW